MACAPSGRSAIPNAWVRSSAQFFVRLHGVKKTAIATISPGCSPTRVTSARRSPCCDESLAAKCACCAGTAAVATPDIWTPASNAATFPWASHALWFYSQMVRWGQTIYSPAAEQTARGVYRPDLYRAALQPIGVLAPSADMKIERTVHAPGFAAEGFFDGRIFDPQDVANYIASFN